ncbi:hypothetical protein LPJ59_006468, partial [Coemansia sp. RSA 2399]
QKSIEEARYLVVEDAGERIDRVVEIQRFAKKALDQVVDKIDKTTVAVDSRALEKAADSVDDVIHKLLDAIDCSCKAELVEKRSKG